MGKLLEYGSRGDRVKRLQRDLNANRLRHLKHKLVVDGEMGPRTCSAIHAVKFWAGYAPKDLDPDIDDQIAGDFFFRLLEGEPLPEDYRRRRKARIKKAAERAAAQPLRVKALAAAKLDVNLYEGPGNRIKYNDWWLDGKIDGDKGDGGAYCVRAGSYWYKKAGSKIIDRAAGRFENTDYLLACAKAGKYDLHLVSDAHPGHGFVIDFSGRSDPDHFGLYVEDLGGGWFRSLEANATLANGRQGVGYHKRQYRNCWFIEFDR